MRRLTISILILILSSCSLHTSTNKISHTDLSFRGGVYGDKKWDDRLEFVRTSWYKGLVLNYDILIATVSDNSPFKAWLADSKNLTSSCRDLKVVLSYSHFDAQASESQLRSYLSSSGYSQVHLLDFKKNLEAHFSYNAWKLQRHKFSAYCLKNSTTPKVIMATLPGFQATNILD